jgi:preprotein translocase subunit SecA
MQRLGMEEGVPIEHGMVTKAIERAQKQVEAQNFSVRKHLLEYDDVMNKQRENIYTLRRQLLEGKINLDDEVVDTREYLMITSEDIIGGLVEQYAGKDADPEEWDIDGLTQAVADEFGVAPDAVAALSLDDKSPDEMAGAILDFAVDEYKRKEATLDSTILRRVERDIMLQIVDAQWKDHLYSLDHLKEGIGLRGYGQRDPLVEYKKESFALFQAMKERIDEEMVRYLWRLRPVTEAGTGETRAPEVRPQRRPPQITLNQPRAASPLEGLGQPAGGEGGPPMPPRTGGDDATPRTVRRDEPKVGRNDPCPCGSGKKYKKCHGAA